MSQMSKTFSLKSRLILGGGGLLLFCIAYRRVRRVKLSIDSNGSAQKTRMEGDDSASSVHSALTLPVDVEVTQLANGWSIAPPIFHPPHMAIIPLLRPGLENGTNAPDRTDCLIVSDGPLKFVQYSDDVEEFFKLYVRATPLLESFDTSGIPLMSLDKFGLSSPSGCFTHMAIQETEQTAIIFGRNGPYVVWILLTRYTSTFPNGYNSEAVPAWTREDVQMILHACRQVPLVDARRLPGTPSGSQQGRLRVTCCRNGRMVSLTTPSDVCVVAGKTPGVLLTLEGDALPGGAVSLTDGDFDHLIAGAEPNAIFSRDVFSDASGVSVQVEEERPMRSGPEVWHDPTPIEADGVKAVFTHAPLGISFSVHTGCGVVREPLLTEDLVVLYYPLGDAEETPPRVTIRLVTNVPLTWEKYMATEDELKHNVLFHFTDWAHERVPCAVCDVNGCQAVRLYEEKEGYGCRTYVVPRPQSILVVRFESKASQWEEYLPILQNFLDTLHLMKPLA